MSAGSHLRFGYAVQISSLLTLALVNIGLPNWIGAPAFARLNEANAFIGFSCIIFNDGVALLLIRAISRAGSSPLRARNIALQGAFEHALLAIAGLMVVMAAVAVLAPRHVYAATDWLMVGVTGVIVAFYVSAVAWLTARLQNRLVALLAMVQGLLSFLLPLAAVKLGLDVRWSIICTYAVGLATCAWWLRTADSTRWRPALAANVRVALVPALPAASAQTAMRTAIVWFPVLLLAARDDLASSAAYKIGLSLALAVCALVPYHRQTMLSLDGHTDAKAASQLAAGAVLLATGGALVLVFLARPMTALLYSRELGVIASFLPAVGTFVVLQVLTDVLLVRLMALHDDRTLLWACGAAIGAAGAAAVLAPTAWLPSLTLLAFLGMALARRGMQAEWVLPLRAAAVGVVAALAAALLPLWLGAGASAALVIGTLAMDSSLRAALTGTFRQMLGRPR